MTETRRPKALERIIEAAAGLIRLHGTEAVTTRAVAAAAGVQPPAIYRLIGDKEALLDAVAEYELAAYVATKKDEQLHLDPVEDLRRGWDRHIAFGLANPALFRVMSSNAESPAALSGLATLRQRIRAIALMGRLRCNEEQAAAMVHAAGVGVVMNLISRNELSGYGDLSTDVREAVIQAITTGNPTQSDGSLANAAATLRVRVKTNSTLTAGERILLDEWLVKLANET